VLTPMRQLAIEERARLLLAVWEGVERGDDRLVAVEWKEVVEIRRGERATNEPRRDDPVAF